MLCVQCSAIHEYKPILWVVGFELLYDRARTPKEKDREIVTLLQQQLVASWRELQQLGSDRSRRAASHEGVSS